MAGATRGRQVAVKSSGSTEAGEERFDVSAIADGPVPSMTRIETALTRLLGITHPILLAPMGSAAGGKLAAAVTHAGGLGLIGSGYADAGSITRELMAAGNARVGVGFITWALDAKPEALQAALVARPAVIMLSFGDPMPYVAAIRDAGSKIICQVQTLAE